MNSPPRKSVGRNVYGEPFKDKYVDLRLSQKQTDGRSLACSSELIVACWESGGGGTVGVITTNRLGQRNPPVTLFRGHKGSIQDIEFSPFYSTIFASASEDSTIKLWDSPTPREAEPQRDSVATLSGHDKRVSFVSFNPVAEWVIASGGVDGTVRVWDLEVQKCLKVCSIQSVQSLNWNANGSLLASTTKDRVLKVMDPRQCKEVASCKSHEGAKPTKVAWLYGRRVGSDSLLLTTGFSKMADRQYALWDLRNLTEAIQREDIDRQSGVINPVFDGGTGLLFLSGKGDGNIRFYEAIDGVVSKVGVYSSTTPAHDLAYLEKRSVDVMRCEVMRAYKRESASVIQPISFIVPRRNMSEFQEDLFPPCPCGDAVLTAEEWFSGLNGEPKLGSMAPIDGESPFKRDKRPVNVGNLLFSRQRQTTAVSSTPSVLQKRMTMQGRVLENDKFDLQDEIRRLEEQLNIKVDLLRDRDIEIARLCAEIKDLRAMAMLPPKKEQMGVFSGDEGSGDIATVAFKDVSPPFQTPRALGTGSTQAPPSGSSIRDSELSTTRQLIKETQEVAKATTHELRVLREETSALNDVGKLAKENLETMRELLEKQHLTKEAGRSPRDLRDSGKGTHGPHTSMDPEQLLERIAILEARNRELENLFRTLRAASKVEKRRSAQRADADTDLLVPLHEQRFYKSSCVPGLSACRGL